MKEYYDETDLLRGKLDLLSNTSMVDFAMDVHKSLYPDREVPNTLKDKRAEVQISSELANAHALGRCTMWSCPVDATW